MEYSGEVKSHDRTAESPGASAGDVYLPGSGNGGYSVSHYDLDLDYKVSSNRLTGTAVITASASQTLGRFSLDLVGLVAGKVSVDGVRAAKAVQNAQKLTITPARPIEAGASFIVSVRYGGCPGPRKTPWGEVGWEELAEGVIVAGQPCGAATWFPCNDHPGDKATMRLTVTADSPYRVVANGTLVSQTVKASRTRWVFETSEPMATYLATVQIGYYQPYALPPARIPQHAYIPDDLAVDFGSDFADQPAMIETFEELFGDFPFGEYTVVVTDDDLEIPLEAHGLSVFGRNHVDGNQGEVRLIAHELAHSWFGNSLTAQSWKHIWLHEGFACYAEWLWSEASGAQSADRLAQSYWTRLNGLPQDFSIGDPGPDFMFDDRLYKRGALTLHALRRTIGDTAFFAMLREWTNLNRHGSVTTEQFIAHVGASADRPTGPLLAAWLFDHELPRLPARRR